MTDNTPDQNELPQPAPQEKRPKKASPLVVAIVLLVTAGLTWLAYPNEIRGVGHAFLGIARVLGLR